MIKVTIIGNLLPSGTGRYFGRREETAGGWVSGLLKGLETAQEFKATYIAFEKQDAFSVQEHEIKGISFILAGYRNEKDIQDILHRYPADVYHYYGAETETAKYFVNCLPYERTLIYIQGIITACMGAWMASYDKYHDVSAGMKLYMKLNQNLLKKHSETELSIFRKAKFIAGRTAWDHETAESYGFQGIYYHLDETLRNDFYTAESWNLKEMKPHTIFVSQASYPLKAAHMVIEIVKILKQDYQDVICYIGGENLMESASLATRLHVSYAAYIQKLIHEYHLEEQIRFTGTLNEKEVITHLQKANVFLLPSAMENSSNSLQEAMILGVPSAASSTGGTPGMVGSEDNCLLYPFDEPEKGAEKIAQIFDNEETAVSLSQNGRKRIQYLADPMKNAEQVKNIYLDMYEKTRQK
ncbi:MAG: glycosyltransferase [Bulleidia sp.]|nr:glycosyltransferase [Bulleidia sp.]